MSCFDNGYVGKQPLIWKQYCAEYWLKELQENMYRCTGDRDITERLLKTTSNTIQSFNQPTFNDPFENIVGKGENAGNKHFLLFQQCFLPNQ